MIFLSGGSEGVDGLEWDVEDFGANADDSVSEIGLCVDRWLDDNLELDLEAELSRLTSERSSRRNSLGSDLDSTHLYRSVRLPPSGRSSVTHGCAAGGEWAGETPRKNIDREMLIRSFGVLTSTSPPPKEATPRPGTLAMSKRRSPAYSRCRFWKLRLNESSMFLESHGLKH
jgi:hypothetical protein